jgi:hypothetical protein
MAMHATILLREVLSILPALQSGVKLRKAYSGLNTITAVPARGWHWRSMASG